MLAALVATALAVPTAASARAPGGQSGGPSSGHGSGGPLAPVGLRADGQASDALTDAAHPSFAWTVRDTGRAEAQTAYELRVAPARNGGKPAAGASWDSGRVRSADSTAVSYAGPALAADRTYTWTVRTWNKEGAASPGRRPPPSTPGC